MGSVKADLSKNEKRLDDSYPLDTFHGVYALLTNLHYVRESRYARGDYDACNLVLDLLRSMDGALLTARQKEVIFLAFELDLKQDEVAGILNVSQQAVSDHINSAVKKIALYNHVREGG